MSLAGHSRSSEPEIMIYNVLIKESVRVLYILDKSNLREFSVSLHLYPESVVVLVLVSVFDAVDDDGDIDVGGDIVVEAAFVVDDDDGEVTVDVDDEDEDGSVVVSVFDVVDDNDGDIDVDRDVVVDTVLDVVDDVRGGIVVDSVFDVVDDEGNIVVNSVFDVVGEEDVDIVVDSVFDVVERVVEMALDSYSVDVKASNSSRTSLKFKIAF